MNLKLFSTFFLMVILFLKPFPIDALFSEFFQNIKTGLMGETESNNNNKDIISAIDNPDSIQQNNKLESSNDEAKDNNQQKSPGSYFDLKYKHFGFGGPNNKDNNSFNGNKLKYSINEEKKLNNQSDEIKEREENEEDRLFTRVANWFKQNAAEILTKGKDFFKINKKKDKKSEDGQETIEN